MLLYPNEYLNRVTEITPEFLEQKQLKGLILDVDNTLIDYDRKLVEGAEDWIASLKQKGYSFCILSNSNKLEKVETVAKTLDIPFIHLAKKPLKGGFRKAKEILGVSEKEIAVVGDQIMTDVIGANRSNMFSILVKPVAKKDIWITVLKRPIENKIIQMYVKKKEKEGVRNVHS